MAFKWIFSFICVKMLCRHQWKWCLWKECNCIFDSTWPWPHSNSCLSLCQMETRNTIYICSIERTLWQLQNRCRIFFLPAFPSHTRCYVAGVTLTFNTRLPVNVCSTLLLSYNFDASFIFFSAQLIECISVWFHHSVFYLTLFSLRHFSSRLQIMAKVSEFSFDFIQFFSYSFNSAPDDWASIAWSLCKKQKVYCESNGRKVVVHRKCSLCLGKFLCKRGK